MMEKDEDIDIIDPSEGHQNSDSPPTFIIKSGTDENPQASHHALLQAYEDMKRRHQLMKSQNEVLRQTIMDKEYSRRGTRTNSNMFGATWRVGASPGADQEDHNAQFKAQIGYAESVQRQLMRSQTNIIDPENELEELKNNFFKNKNMITNTEFSNKFDQLVTKEFLENVIAGVKRELKEEMSEKMDKLESRIFELELKHDELLKENESLKIHVNENSTFINEVDNGVQHALQKTNDLEQYTRKSNVRIYGLEDEEYEDVPTTVFKVNKLLNEKLKMNIEEKEINIAHRLGKFESEKMRPVIVRFMSRQRKIETIKLRRALAKTQYVIKEDLTKDNQEFLNELNTVDNVETAWTNEGKFFAKLSPSGAILRVFHNTDLSNLRPPRNWRPKRK